MIFRGLRLLAPKFSTKYSQAMYEAWKANPKDVHDDWHTIFASQERASHVNVGSPEHIEREKSLALSAYMLIRYYKMRGHEEAILDPLSNSSSIQDWSTSRSLERFILKTNSITISSTTRFSMTVAWMSLLPSLLALTSRIRSQYALGHIGFHRREAAMDFA